MKYHLVSLIALALTTSACAQIPHDQAEVTLEPVFDDTSDFKKDECLRSLTYAVETWKKAAPAQARLRIVKPGEHGDFAVIFSTDLISSNKHIVGQTWAYGLEGTRSYGLMNIRSNYAEKCMNAIVLHELGHVLGLRDDYDNRESIMQSLNSKKPMQAPSAADVAKVVEASKRAEKVSQEDFSGAFSAYTLRR